MAKTTIESYEQLREALEGGKVPIIASIDFSMCTLETPNTHHYGGKSVHLLDRTTILPSGEILMLTHYKVSPRVVGKADRESKHRWVEWQSAYTIGQQSSHLQVSFIATGYNDEVIKESRYQCPLNKAALLWKSVN